MDEATKKLVEGAEKARWEIVLQPTIIQDGRTSVEPCRADMTHVVHALCAEVRRLDEENEQLQIATNVAATALRHLGYAFVRNPSDGTITVAPLSQIEAATRSTN